MHEIPHRALIMVIKNYNGLLYILHPETLLNSSTEVTNLSDLKDHWLVTTFLARLQIYVSFKDKHVCDK